MKTDNPDAAVLVIGDEILSGRTHDSNIRHIATKLGSLGIEMSEARIVPDVHDRIMSAVRDLSSQYDYLFTTGGIGPTHDDITADAVAAAFDRSIDIRQDARVVLQAWYDPRGVELTDARLRMARIPEGAELIENTISGAPGFRLENVYVMAGVPRIMHAMLDAVLPTLRRGHSIITSSLQVDGSREADIAPALKAASEAHPDVSIGSYPGDSHDGRGHIVLIVSGIDAIAVSAAVNAVGTAMQALGLSVLRDPTLKA